MTKKSRFKYLYIKNLNFNYFFTQKYKNTFKTQFWITKHVLIEQKISKLNEMKKKIKS
jgi:hypothetical protein